MRFLALFAVVMFLSQTAIAGIRWAPLYEPGCGGWIVSLAASPHNPRHLIAGGDMLGTASSFDGGESWTPGMCLPAYEMAAATFHPERPNELWIGSCMGPFLSRDGGRSWQWRRRGMPKPERWRYTAIIEKVLVDPKCPDRLLAFGGSSRCWRDCETMGAVWLSENDGEDWSRVGTIGEAGFTTNTIKGANIIKAWWSAEKKPWVNAFVADIGWFSSMDGGLTWRRRKLSGLPGAVENVTTHPSAPNVVWAVVAPGKSEEGGSRTPGGIWKSTDGGRSFFPGDAGIVKVSDANPNRVSHFSEIEVSPVPPHRLYVSDLGWRSCAVWVSDDGGQSWRRGCTKASLQTACFAGPGCRVSASPVEADVAYAYNSEYVLKTVDAGRTWKDMTAFRPDAQQPSHWRGRGWNGWCSRAVTFNPYRCGQSVVQAMDAARGWVSDDGLKSWRYALGGADPWCGGVAAAFGRDGYVYLTTGQFGNNNGVAVSADGGQTWTVRAGAAHGLPERNAGEYGGVWVDPSDDKHAFVIFRKKRYVTMDGGLFWQGEAIERAGMFVADPTKPNRFYLKNSEGVFATTDWKTFRPLGLGGAAEGQIACDVYGRILVCRGRIGDPNTRGLWRCDPHTGGEWVLLHADALACAAAADPLDPSRIILTTADNPYHDFSGGNGVFISSDDGKTWTPANDGLHVRRLTCVAFDPFDGERIVAGTTGGGFVTTKWKRGNGSGE